MGLSAVSAITIDETVFGDNHATIKPVWTLTRELGSPDPMAHGRKPTAWPDGGTAYALGAPELEGGWGVYINKPGGTAYAKSWDYLFTSFGQPAWVEGFLLGVPTEVFQAESKTDIGAIVGSDVDVVLQGFFNDFHLQDVPADSDFVIWDNNSYSRYPAPTNEEQTASSTPYRTRAQAAVLPQLIPYQVADTFISFEFGVNPMTKASLANVYLRWKLGTNTDTANWDDQLQILTNAQSKTEIRKNITISNLLPGQHYTFWLHIDRNTNGLTTADGEVKTWEQKPQGQVTFPSEGATIHVSPSPTQCKFSWATPMIIDVLGYLPPPASQVEVMTKADYDAYGWDATRTIYTRLVPATVPDVTRGDVNAGTVPGFTLFNSVLTAIQKQMILGNGAVTQLRAHRDYVYRLRIDFAGGASYPLSGIFSTPDYNAAQPEESEQYTEGVY